MLNKSREKDYRAYKEDVDIAIAELTKMKLYPIDGTIICDLYAIPSHNRQSYYVIIYEKDGRFDMVYAKPLFYEPITHEYVKMYRFRAAKEVENHPVKAGKIILGIKHLSAEFVSVINDILGNMPAVRHNDGFMIDGCYQAIRAYKNNIVCDEAIFGYKDELVLPKEKEYLLDVLDELYIRIGELIE